MVPKVWAPYSNFNFENWDRSVTERCHMQFLLRILGCDIHTPNLMVQAKLGKRPLLYDAINRSILYIKCLESTSGTLANCSLETTLPREHWLTAHSTRKHLVLKIVTFYLLLGNFRTTVLKEVTIFPQKIRKK